MLKKLRFESSNGKAVQLYGSPYRLYFVEGLGVVEVELQVQHAPYQDGSMFIDALLQERHITIELRINASSEIELAKLKMNLSSTLSPKLGLGKLIHEDPSGTKEIMAICNNVPFFPDGETNRGPLFQKALITLIAPNPYWLDPEKKTRELKAYEGDFTFPFEFPVQFGIESDSTTIYNEGDTEAPVVVEINGPITRPLIENITTGEHMQINAIIQADQTLVIDTSPRNKRVEIRSENETRKVMGFFDHSGDFWLLAPGENEIRYRADAGIAEATATVSWQSQYVGI